MQKQKIKKQKNTTKKKKRQMKNKEEMEKCQRNLPDMSNLL